MTPSAATKKEEKLKGPQLVVGSGHYLNQLSPLPTEDLHRPRMEMGEDQAVPLFQRLLPTPKSRLLGPLPPPRRGPVAFLCIVQSPWLRGYHSSCCMEIYLLALK